MVSLGTLWFLASFYLLVLATIIRPTTADNTLQFINHCPYPIYFWVIGPADTAYGETRDEDYSYVAPGDTFNHPMIDLGGGGVSLKMRDLPNFRVAPKGIIQAEYMSSPSETSMWYDLSYIDCRQSADHTDPFYCPFAQGGIRMYTTTHDASCPPIHCQLGGECEKTYLIEGGWTGEPSWHCLYGSNLVVETCTDGPGVQSLDPTGNAQLYAGVQWTPVPENPLWYPVAPENPVPQPAPEYPPAPTPEYPPVQDYPEFANGFQWDSAAGEWIPWYNIQDPEARSAAYDTLPVDADQENSATEVPDQAPEPFALESPSPLPRQDQPASQTPVSSQCPGAGRPIFAYSEEASEWVWLQTDGYEWNEEHLQWV